MRIEKTYKKTGYFWLPDKPDDKIPGILTIKDGGKIELEVVGLFADNTLDIPGEEDLKRIIGHVEDDGLLTLEDCFYRKKNISIGGISKSLIHVNLALSGVAYGKDEKHTFDNFSFSIDHLDEWVDISGIKVETNFESRTSTIHFTPPDNISYSLANGVNLEIYFAPSFPGYPHITEAKITQRVYFNLQSVQLQPLEDFIKIAYKITNLLCFAIDSTVSIKNVSATSSEIEREIGDGKFYPVPVKIYYASRPFSPDISKTSLSHMLFTFDAIQKNAEKVFNKWINAYETISPALGLCFSSRAGAHKFLEGKFLALAQGLETYHRRNSDEKLMDHDKFEKLVDIILKNCPKEKVQWLNGRLKHGNEINFGNRIKKIIQPFKIHFGNNKDRKRLIRKIVDTRNYLTHYDEPLQQNAAQGKELYRVCSTMEALFQLHFMKVIGFTNDEVSQVIKDCYPFREKLKKI